MQISSKCSIAVHCLIFIHEYGNRQKVTSELLALSAGCNPVTIRTLMSRLSKAGILDIKFGTGGAQIKAPLQDITLYRICEAVDPGALKKVIGIHAAPSPFCPVGRNIKPVLNRSYDLIRQDMIERMKKISLEDMINDYREQVSTEH